MALATIGDDLQIQLGDVHSHDDFSVGETRALEEASQRIGGEVLMDMLLETDSGHEHYFSNQPTVAAVAQDREASGPQQRQRHRGLFPIEMMPNGGRAAGSKDSWVNAHIAQCKFERDTHGTFHWRLVLSFVPSSRRRSPTEPPPPTHSHTYSVDYARPRCVGA